MKGFSRLDTEERETYLDLQLNGVGARIKPFLNKAFVFNTWGDAVIAVFQDGIEAAAFMLNYRSEAIASKDAFPRKKVLPRIAGHYGKVDFFLDPLLDRFNTISDEVNTAARIEPITRAGEIFVSTEFEKAFKKQNPEEKSVKFERLGTLSLAKGHGEKELYRLIRQEEAAHIIDTLFELDLPPGLPEVLSITAYEKDLLDRLRSRTMRSEILLLLALEREKEHTGIFSFQAAEICKKAGLYEEGLEWLRKAEQEKVTLSDIDLFPFSNKKEVIKLKADLLTRLDRYSESADILYRLWRNIEEDNAKDASDILSMLAAQFKRRAITKDGKLLSRENINRKMLEKSASLYLEAFRHNFDDYYPAINAAYLLLMSGGEKAESGKKLAIYILESWKHEKGSTHWLDFTFAEANLLLGNYQDATEGLKKALEDHQQTVGVFQLEAIHFQINNYLTYMKKREEGIAILKILEIFIEKARH